MPPRTTAVMLVSVYADPCDGSPIPYCPISISAPRNTNRDEATYASTTVLLTLMPMRTGGLLVRAHRPQPPAPGPAPERELQGDHDHHEDDEGDRDGPQGVVHGGLEGLADVAVLRRPQQEARTRPARCTSPSVAAMGVNFPNRIREPLTSPTRAATASMIASPRSTLARDLPSLTKNEAITTRKPGERSDGEVDAAGQQGDVLPERDEAQRGRRRQQVGDVEGARGSGRSPGRCTPPAPPSRRAAAPSACSRRG